MVTCPWCGTSYIAFQPNCSNCGGPILAPAREEDKLVTPPLAPRPISSQYTWKLLLSDGMAIAAFVTLLLGVIFTPLGLALSAGLITAFVGLPFLAIGLLFLAGGFGLGIWRFQVKEKLVNVLREGEAVRGEITSVEENPLISVNHRHPWRIEYQYRVNGQWFRGQADTYQRPAPALQAGKPTYVLYLPDTPQLSALYPHP